MRALPLRLAVSILGCVLITSCATVPAPETPRNETVGWDSRALTLANMHSWDVKGQVAIRTAKNAESISVRWQQNNQNYAINLFGPLGTNSYLLTGSKNQAVLTAPNGKKITADSAETLLIQQTGWDLPVSNLKYWIRGLPVPGMPAQKKFDAYHHLTALDQDGWRIEFLRYTSVKNIDLPSKLFLNRGDISVKLIISQWQARS